MSRFKNAAALIPAAGSGIRLGHGPKAFLKLRNETLLNISVMKVFPLVEHIHVGVQKEHLDRAGDIAGKKALVIPGGPTRQQTIANLLRKSREEIILILDITHPFASTALIERVIQTAVQRGSAVPVVSSEKPACVLSGGEITGSLEAADFYFSQMPQAFHREILEEAYRHADRYAVETHSTWQLILASGKRIHTVRGEEGNIKITTRIDWEIAGRLEVSPNHS